MCVKKQIRDFDNLYELKNYFDKEETCQNHNAQGHSTKSKTPVLGILDIRHLRV